MRIYKLRAYHAQRSATRITPAKPKRRIMSNENMTSYPNTLQAINLPCHLLLHERERTKESWIWGSWIIYNTESATWTYPAPWSHWLLFHRGHKLLTAWNVLRQKKEDVSTNTLGKNCVRGTVHSVLTSPHQYLDQHLLKTANDTKIVPVGWLLTWSLQEHVAEHFYKLTDAGSDQRHTIDMGSQNWTVVIQSNAI